ncbi:TonB-dependent receptor [Pseudoxanthomonas suwonensis 11-1]|uniref:TonB-dependent receptor n=1 Tax=Pseudoxanthomonas suwonensis (strain 11-1) TaxID=743721 RepID=E6WV85_PSEUU|nr:TonB-dependent receptor [Pseudoxanthomonas suwonensis]ADV28084.1 TonB-dependent receptor [Pseudoxanthomonas suwonensis 11-1]
MYPARAPLAAALALACLALSAPALAHDDPTDLPALQVTASPLPGDAESLTRPVEVLQGETLDDARGATLGETVARLPGVQTSYFGPGVGRPILRGLDGPRVQVLASGLGSQDASTVSADHAASVEPFLADQIEVLKGPATLLFGSGAIGGAVNVVDGRIAREVPEAPLSGRAELRGNTVNHERSGMFRLDGVSGGNLVLHADGLVRDTDDYRIPGQAHATHAEGEDEAGHDTPAGHLANSAMQTRAAGLGLTWFGEAGYLGVAASTYRSEYGIPPGAHVHAHPHDDDHDHDHDHGGDGEEEHGHEAHEADVRVDLRQDRLELKGGIYNPASFLERIDFHGAWSDYEHVELEGHEVGTRFTSRGHDARLQAVQQELAGWRGAFGLQSTRVDFGAVGAEAFVPGTVTRSTGVFVLQEKSAGPLKMEFGARHDRVELDPQGANPQRSFGATSLSASAIWKLTPALDLRFGADRSERAPTQEELYASGLHVATASLEIGDARLETESALRGEIGLHAHHSRFDLELSVYRSRFDDFIHLADTGVSEDGVPVRLWTQAGAVFTGAEAEAIVHLADNASGRWDLRLFADHVRGSLDGSGSRTAAFGVPHADHLHAYTVELDNGGPLPRIAPGRFGASLGWDHEGWRASLGAVRYRAQDRVARNEEPSPGYTLVDAHLSYGWDQAEGGRWEVFLDGSNLTDAEARPHTSLLREYAPLPGRAVAFGIRAWF